MEDTPQDATEDRVMDELLRSLDHAERVANTATSVVKNLRGQVAERLSQIEKKRYAHEHDGIRLNATMVTTRPIVIDFDKMIRDDILDEEQLSAIFEHKPSRALFEEAVNSGLIEGSVVQPYVSTGKETKSVRFTSKSVPGDGQD